MVRGARQLEHQQFMDGMKNINDPAVVDVDDYRDRLPWMLNPARYELRETEQGFWQVMIFSARGECVLLRRHRNGPHVWRTRKHAEAFAEDVMFDLTVSE